LTNNYLPERAAVQKKPPLRHRRFILLQNRIIQKSV
jgi:hypothetical protein